MKALSIKQPWASLIAHGIKNIENRTWKTKFRGRIYIHASAKDAGALYELLNEKQIEAMNNHWTAAPPYPNRPISAIIGEVDIIDCVINHPSIWAEYTSGYEDKGVFIPNQKPNYNWVLSNPVLYDKPILNVKGKLSFWEPDIDIIECIGCSQKFDYELMNEDSVGEKYCSECEKILFPIMKMEYDLAVQNGEFID